MAAAAGRSKDQNLVLLFRHLIFSQKIVSLSDGHTLPPLRLPSQKMRRS